MGHFYKIQGGKAGRSSIRCCDALDRSTNSSAHLTPKQLYLCAVMEALGVERSLVDGISDYWSRDNGATGPDA